MRNLMDNENSPKTRQVTEQSEDKRVGEKITYDVILGKVRLGKAVYHHLKKTQLNEDTVNLISFETRVAQFHDQETIYCDVKTFLPLMVERKVSQILKPEKIQEVYDQKNFVLTITKKRFTTEEIIIKKDAPIHNSILLPFFVRNNFALNIGWSFEANLPQQKYKIMLKSIETVDVPAGKFEAYYFESEPNRIKIWISTDTNRVPLKLEGTGGLGYKLLMKEYERPAAGN
ncbi:MAG: DUF3108 domain-containing protein [Candidatus Omnitrophica bacterium]|nr:DUF3108 domain-containing protein [Candidatus Omnitrophota bacterium]